MALAYSKYLLSNTSIMLNGYASICRHQQEIPCALLMNTRP